jgi:hypothetical protein
MISDICSLNLLVKLCKTKIVAAQFKQQSIGKISQQKSGCKKGNDIFAHSVLAVAASCCCCWHQDAQNGIFNSVWGPEICMLVWMVIRQSD